MPYFCYGATIDKAPARTQTHPEYGAAHTHEHRKRQSLFKRSLAAATGHYTSYLNLRLTYSRWQLGAAHTLAPAQAPAQATAALHIRWL